MARKRHTILDSDSDAEVEEEEKKEPFEPLYESHIIQETPEFKPIKRKRVLYAELEDSDDGNNGNSSKMDSTFGSDDEFKPNDKKMAVGKAWRPKKQNVRLFHEESDEIGIMAGTTANGKVSKVETTIDTMIVHLSKRVPGYENDFYKDVLIQTNHDAIKAERHIRQMMATRKASPTKLISSDSSSVEKFPKLKSVKTAMNLSTNGFTPVLAKPDRDFIADNHKKSLVSKAELLSDSDSDCQPIPSTSNGRTALPKFGAKDSKSFYFSKSSVLKPTVQQQLPGREKKKKEPKQKRRFMTQQQSKIDTLEDEESNDSFINDDSDIEEILSGDEEEEEVSKNVSKKKGQKKKKESKDELLEFLDSSGSDADVDEDRIILTSDEDDLDEGSDEDDKPKKKKAKKKEKQSTLKERVWKFMGEATLCDLMSVPGVSKKKAELITTLRPFANYTDFALKIRSTKGLTSEIINAALSAIKSRDVVHKLMSDCENISSSIHAMVSELKEAKQPKILNSACKLKQYQMIGLNWLVLMHKKGINAILADEMGLGKTIQVIALLAHIRENFGIKGHHCIVVPASTMDNWDRELSTWCPDIDVLVYHGSQAERAELREKITSDSMKFDCILTTYNMLFSDDDKKLFKRKSFEYIIFDEAHMLKNMKTARYEKLLRIEARHRLLLTGTPLQNNLLELMSLLIFTMPNLFQGRTDHVRNMFTFSSTSGADSASKSSYEQERIDHAKKIMKPFILRRLKDDVLKQLPTKTVIIKKCTMTASQLRKYQKMIASYQDEIRKDDSIIEDIDITDADATIIEAPSDRVGGLEGSPKKGGSIKSSSQSNKSDKNSSPESSPSKGRRKELEKLSESKLKVSNVPKVEPISQSVVSSEEEDDQKRRKAGTAMLMNLRKGANHPLLNRIHYNSTKLRQMAKLMLKEPTHKDANPDLIYEDMELHSDFELHQLCLKYKSLLPFKLPDIMILDSGKFKVLDELLPNLKKNGQKVLIFSQFVMVLDIVESYLNIRGHKFTRLDGSTKITDRLDLIDEFNSEESDCFIFLLTTKAGGVGINLTAATVAIIHDIDFNPYNDKQAEDRCHRVGQTKEVTVYKLISACSIEEGMLSIADNKLKLGEDLCGTEKKGQENQTSKKDMKTLIRNVLNL